MVEIGSVETATLTGHEEDSLEVVEQRTQIQQLIDFFTELYPVITYGVAFVPYGSRADITDRNKIVAVQEVTKQQWPSAWGGFFGNVVTKTTSTMTVGYNYKVAFKLHCMSFLSYGEADQIADLVEKAFTWTSWAFNQDRKPLMYKHGIIKMLDIYRRPSIPVLETEIARIIVDIDLKMARRELVTTIPIRKINLNLRADD